MQVGHQIVELLLRELLLERRHLRAAKQDDVCHPLVICRYTTCHELLLEQPVQAGTSQIARAVSVMALGAARVIHTATQRLLRIQSEFSIGLAWLRVAACETYDERCRQPKNPDASAA